jgi:hypothetical protein
MRKFWFWFDKLDGLWKLLLILLFLAIGIGAISVGFVVEKHSPYLIFGGLFFILLLFLNRACFLDQEAASRRLHIRSKRP